MEFQSVQHSIDKLIQWIRTGRLALPDFQRDFVWNPSRVVELLDSVARQWPIGSLLLLSGPQPFGVRPIEGAPPVTRKELDTYVLDGQQRLTSLYHAINDVSDFCYYVDFEALARDEEDYIRWEKREAFQRKYIDMSARARNSIALITDIWDADRFYAWLETVQDSGKQRSYVLLRDRRLGGLQSKVYKIMAIELDQEIQIEALARIFETLNRTGVRLNAFDLMVAMLYPTGFHLRDKWDEARLSFDVFDEYQVDPIEVLKLTALLIRAERGRQAARGVRQGDLLEIDRGYIRETWDNAVYIYAKSLAYSRDSLGIFCADVMPAWSMQLGVAAWVIGPAVPGARNDLGGWYWGSAFAQTYAQAANTVAVSDFDTILAGRGPGLSISRMADPFNALREPARRNGLAMRAFACLLANLGALDIVTGQPLRESSSVAFRVLDGGMLRKISGDDSFDKLVVMSKESDKLLSKGNALALHGADPREMARRLESQLMDAGVQIRNVDAVRQIVTQIFEAGGQP